MMSSISSLKSFKKSPHLNLYKYFYKKTNIVKNKKNISIKIVIANDN
ncbi:hypothetical protein HMPREF0220_2020 [Clostridioides difficile NAP08]|uniref:Uncharacterized protein n=1 Tax=Clostridioides difficile NAP08 TaxID=525259 RepID=D5Q538_CLODI|nr:hypothetical protein HMPREF0220_2020 [Clostridioides difficile NAP08]EFH15880.1 hypothetical protein HMPREF0219_1525 [Clostridioides difficile NAP07]